MAELLSLSGILDAVARSNLGEASAAAGLQSNAAQAQKLSEADAMLQTAIGGSAQIIESAKQLSALGIQNARLKAANAAGTNLKDVGERITGLTQVVHDEYAKREQALAEVSRKKSVTLFDNPVEYILNTLTINQDIEAHNTANQRLANAKGQIADLNALTQTTIQTQNSLDESITTATMDAGNKALAAKANMLANASSVQALVHNSDGIRAALTADRAITQNQFSAFGAQKSEQQAQMALEQLNFQREKFLQDREARKLAQGSDAEILDKVNKGRVARMGPNADVIVPGSLRAASVLSLLKSNSLAGQEYAQDFMTGERYVTTGGKRVLATSAANAVEVLDRFPVYMTPSQEPIKDVLKTAYAEALSGKAVLGKAPLDTKNKAQVEQYINQRVNELLANQAAKIVPGDETNPYNIGKLKTLIDSSPALQQSSVVQKLVAPMIAAGTDVDNPKMLFAAAAAALKAGTISYAEMTTIPQLYQVGVDVRNADRQFEAFGIASKNTYNVELGLHPGALWGGKQTVNLSDTAEYARAMNKYLASQMFFERRTGMSMEKK